MAEGPSVPGGIGLATGLLWIGPCGLGAPAKGRHDRTCRRRGGHLYAAEYRGGGSFRQLCGRTEGRVEPIRSMNQRPGGISQVRKFVADDKARSSLAYRAVVLFSVIYFLRPEDFIPGLNVIPIGKITGGMALFALIFVVPASRRHKLSPELKVLLLLLVQMILCIPFAAWRGGAFSTGVNKFSKGVIAGIPIANVISLVTTSVNEVRKLLAIQAGTIALVTLASIFVLHTQDGRLMGIQQGI